MSGEFCINGFRAALFSAVARLTAKMPNPVVFFDVAIGGKPAGRIEMT